jgi:hypothetical protein
MMRIGWRMASLLWMTALFCGCHTTVHSPSAPTPTPVPTPPGCTSPTPPPSAQTVTSNADSGPGSLRDALAAAPGNGFVNFASNLTGTTIALTSGPLAINNNVTVLGPCPAVAITGSGPLISIGNATSATLNNLALTSTGASALTVGTSAFLVANGLVITGSSAPSCTAISVGAGNPTVNLVSSTISHNSASGDGIICESAGNLSLTQVTLSTNTTGGAGTIDLTGGNTTVLDSEFDSNKSGPTGGAITVSGGFLVMTNSTLYNDESSKGAAVYIGSTGNATFKNITAVANTAPQIYNSGVALFHNSLIANAPGVDVTGTVASNGYNFIGNASTSSGWVGTDILNQSIQLYKFGYYGGPTDTIPPVQGAVAVNGGDPNDGTCPATDQRLLARPIGPRCDIGAVEFNFASPP